MHVVSQHHLARMFWGSILASFLLLKVIDANQCQKIICGNPLEKCVENATHATCVCKDGFYRTSPSLCDRACDIHYCFHDGVCEQGPNGKTCRCVSPFHGSRCENEQTVSVQIAVGSSVMAVVLIVFLSVIIWRNSNENKEVKKEMKPWAQEEFQKKPDSFHIYEVETTACDNLNDPKEEGNITDDTSSQHETTVQITPVDDSSRDEEGHQVIVQNVYVNVVAEEDIAIEESKVNKEEESKVNKEEDRSIDMAENSIAEEAQRDEAVAIESPRETTSVSNACVNAEAAGSGPDYEDSKF